MIKYETVAEICDGIFGKCHWLFDYELYLPWSKKRLIGFLSILRHVWKELMWSYQIIKLHHDWGELKYLGLEKKREEQKRKRKEGLGKKMTKKIIKQKREKEKKKGHLLIVLQKVLVSRSRIDCNNLKMYENHFWDYYCEWHTILTINQTKILNV